MVQKAKEEYVVGILSSYKDRTEIKYVTRVQTAPKVAHWEDGKEAMAFSNDYAKDFRVYVNEGVKFKKKKDFSSKKSYIHYI